MITIRQLLATKSRDLYTVSATDSVAAALDLLARHRIGALMVMEGDRLEGIVSERDCARIAPAFAYPGFRLAQQT